MERARTLWGSVAAQVSSVIWDYNVTGGWVEGVGGVAHNHWLCHVKFLHGCPAGSNMQMRVVSGPPPFWLIGWFPLSAVRG